MQPTPIAIAIAMSSSLIAQGTASFTTSELAPTVIQFTDTSSGGTPIAWDWDFENDGVVDATNQNPVFAYPGTGIYQCSLTVDFGTGTDTVVQNVFISVLPIPDFGNTYVSGTQTRGFWFMAPTRFSITSAKVPDESAHGLQNVAIYRMTGAPPVYTASTTGGLEFLSTGTASSSAIPCAVSFDTGEFVGVIGACGDASTMRNSYGTPSGPFQSSILGQATTLTRFITQTNLVSSNGLGPYSQTLSGSISRVELTISSCVGLPYGNGSPSSQAQAPILRTSALPFLGQTATLTLENFDANALGILAVGIGRANIPTPLGDVLIGTLAGSVPLNGGALMTPGSYDFTFPIPSNPALQGFGPVNWQSACLVTGTGEFALSNGNEWWLEL
tara:strand:- start:58 stop:1218 length:1161 start_codon:yes stop_codon:yes gene_type:complete